MTRWGGLSLAAAKAASAQKPRDVGPVVASALSDKIKGRGIFRICVASWGEEKMTKFDSECQICHSSIVVCKITAMLR